MDVFILMVLSFLVGLVFAWKGYIPKPEWLDKSKTGTPSDPNEPKDTQKR